MKISFIVVDITAKAGTERTTTLLANTLLKKGHEVRIISLFRQNISPAFFLEKEVDIVYVTCESYSIHSPLIKRLLRIIRSFFSFREMMRKNDSGLFIGQNFLANLYLYFSGFSKKSIACEHNLYDIYPSPILFFREYVYQSFYKMVSLTEKDADKFRRRLKNVEVIPNMLTFTPKGKADLTSKRILSKGRLSNQKGYDLLLEAVKYIWKDYPDWHLDIFGEGEMHAFLAEKIKRYNMEQYVFLKGYTQDVISEYLSSSIYVMSSRFEGFPMSLLEATSCGLPVVSFDCPEGPADIIGEDRGILVPPEDISGLKTAFIKLMDSLDRRNEYGENGRSFVLQNYNSEAVYKKWDMLFQSFVNSQSK